MSVQHCPFLILWPATITIIIIIIIIIIIDGVQIYCISIFI